MLQSQAKTPCTAAYALCPAPGLLPTPPTSVAPGTGRWDLPEPPWGLGVGWGRERQPRRRWICGAPAKAPALHASLVWPGMTSALSVAQHGSGSPQRSMPTAGPGMSQYHSLQLSGPSAKSSTYEPRDCMRVPSVSWAREMGQQGRCQPWMQ